MVRFAAASRKASQRRAEAEKAGEHIPPFLIASITSACNLHCAGCYSRCNHATVDTAPVRQLTDEEWLSIFRQAEEMGVSFILLAGGAEPCPFSPYSDVNVRDTSLCQALASPFFAALREGELLTDDHAGGCVLFEKRANVEVLL